MTEKPKVSEITNINQQIDALKKQITENNAQIKKHIEKRDTLHEKIKKIREEIDPLRTERDALNEKVKLLKQQRDAVRTLIIPIMDEVKTIDDKIEALKKNLPRISQRDLQEEHDAIEWKIATTSLDLQEEKRLIEDVKAIEIQLSGYKKVDIQNKKIKELLAKRKIFDDQAEDLHKELTDLAQKSQDLHAIIVEKMDTTKRERAEANLLHQAFIKAKENNGVLYDQIKLLLSQGAGIRTAIKEQNQARRKDEEERRQIEDAKRKEEQTEKAAKEQALKEKIGLEAREKLNRGEEVSWDEFQMMLGDEKEDDSQTQD